MAGPTAPGWAQPTWGLGADEALVIEGTMPQCRYWSVSLLTRWMESGDWVHHPVALTGRDVGVSAGEHFRVVVSHRDPGVRPWLATTGMANGQLACRALKSSGSEDYVFTRVALADV